MSKSKFLKKEQPIVVDKELAIILGLNEAIVLQQIEYWININEKSKNSKVFQEGYYWTYQTVEKWREEFPFWSYDTVKRSLKKLRDKEVLITNNFNKEGYDKTLWYRIDYDKLDLIGEIELDKYIKSEEEKLKKKEEIKNKQKALVQNALMSNNASCNNKKPLNTDEHSLVQNAPIEECKMPQPIQEINKEIKYSSSSNNYVDLIRYFEENICKLTINTKFRFETYCKTESTDFVKALIDYQSEIATRSWKGFEMAICNFYEKNIHTVDELQKHIDTFRVNKKNEKYSNTVDIYNSITLEDKEEIWKAYPKKRGKADFMKKIDKILKTVSKEELLRAVERYADEVKDQDMQYIKNGSTFFNGGYIDYLDENYTKIEKKVVATLPTAKKQYAKTETTFKKGCGERTDVNYDYLEKQFQEKNEDDLKSIDRASSILNRIGI